MASASLPVAALALLLALPHAARAAGPDAEMTLRKSFRAEPAPGADPARSRTEAPEPAAPSTRGAPRSPALAASAGALGETLSTSGTLHLPGIGGRSLVLDTASTPLMELASGRRIILDPDGSIAPEDAREIARRWPSYGILRPEPGGGVRPLLSALLEASGYASVARSTPLTYGGEATVRIVPDYVVLRTPDDLLTGEVRAISVLDRGARALPDELRELAARHRILVLELLDPDGTPTPGTGWRDPVGTVTTIGARGASIVVLELADALGVAVGGLPDDPSVPGALSLRSGESVVTVLTRPAPDAAGAAEAVDATDPFRLARALGEILSRLGVPAIGPSIEFSRPDPRSGERRFTITVPGWLVETQPRRLLVTGAELPEQLRLFLTREGIDILQYTVRSR